MTCVKCGQESPDGTAYCPACGTRLVAREWTISGLVVGLIALALLLLGAGGTWLVFGRHKAPPPIPAPTVQVIPGATKPSPQIAADATQPSDVFKDFAPPKDPASAKTPPSTKPATRIETPHPATKPDPLALRTPVAPRRVSMPLPPLQFRLTERRDVVKILKTPDDWDNVRLRAHLSSQGGVNCHARLKILQVNQLIFDSGDTCSSDVNVSLPKGSYTFVFQNTAMMLPRLVTFTGEITGLQR